MPLLPNSGLEDPGTGNPNTSGIISGNFQTIEAMINPATAVADTEFDVIARGFWKDGENVLTPAASVALDMTGHQMASLETDQATTITFTNLAAGQAKFLRLTNNGTGWGLAWPASVVWVGTAGTAPTASKTALVELFAFTAAIVVARFTEEL